MAGKALLALADGRIFEGRAFGAAEDVVGEVVFNTSHTGYQEVLTDPSYAGQIVVMACPEMGNVGVNPGDLEAPAPRAVGLAVKHRAAEPSSWRAREGLAEWLARSGLPAIEGIDTRALVHHLRDHGAQMGVLSTSGASAAALVERARRAPGMAGRDLASLVTCPAPYAWTEGTGDVLGEGEGRPPRAREAASAPHVVAFDFGAKQSILRLLVDAGCRVTVVPAGTRAGEALALRPDGVFLSNGPGDPDAVPGVRETVAALLCKVPIFGICLGHQILALALGGRTYKLKFGHRGANQPVQTVATRRVDITSQNHGFAVDAASLAGKAEITHVNLNDGTVEGLAVLGAPAFGVQYHPEASPGPHDARPLFAEFVRRMGA